MAVNSTDIDVEARRVCEGDRSGHHAVAFEDRLDTEPWTCYRCRKSVIYDPHSGGFRTDLYLVAEEPDPLELLT